MWQYAVISLAYTQGGKRKLTLIRRERDVVIMPRLLSVMDEVSSSKLLIHNFVSPQTGSFTMWLHYFNPINSMLVSSFP